MMETKTQQTLEAVTSQCNMGDGIAGDASNKRKRITEVGAPHAESDWNQIQPELSAAIGLAEISFAESRNPSPSARTKRSKRAKVCAEEVTSAAEAQVKAVKKVRFSSNAPREISCSNYEDGMTEEERSEVRSKIWYSRKDYDDFLRDRVATLRMWRSLTAGSDTDGMSSSFLLEPHYCIRGLEPYLSQRVNAEMHSHRLRYNQAVLREQARIRRAAAAAAIVVTDGKATTRSGADIPAVVVDPVRTRELVKDISTLALQRAERLAALDAQETQDVSRHSLHISVQHQRLMQRRRSSTASAVALMAAGCGSASSGVTQNSVHLRRRRASLTGAPLTGVPVSRPCTDGDYGNYGFAASRRLPVDVNKLKELNANLIKQVMSTPSSSNEGVNAMARNRAALRSADADCSDADMALHSFVATARRRDSLMAGGTNCSGAYGNTSCGTTLTMAARAAFGQDPHHQGSSIKGDEARAPTRSYSAADYRLLQRQRFQRALEAVTAAAEMVESVCEPSAGAIAVGDVKNISTL